MLPAIFYDFTQYSLLYGSSLPKAKVMQPTVFSVWPSASAKGHIKPKADLCTVDSPKKQIRLLVFWENLQPANLLMVLSDL